MAIAIIFAGTNIVSCVMLSFSALQLMHTSTPIGALNRPATPQRLLSTELASPSLHALHALYPWHHPWHASNLPTGPTKMPPMNLQQHRQLNPVVKKTSPTQIFSSTMVKPTTTTRPNVPLADAECFLAIGRAMLLPRKHSYASWYHLSTSAAPVTNAALHLTLPPSHTTADYLHDERTSDLPCVIFKGGISFHKKDKTMKTFQMLCHYSSVIWSFLYFLL